MTDTSSTTLLLVPPTAADATQLAEALRGLTGVELRTEPGTLGAANEVLVYVASSGLVGALAATIRTWILSRRTYLRVFRPDDPAQYVELTASLGEDAIRDLLQQVLSAPNGPSTTSG